MVKKLLKYSRKIESNELEDDAKMLVHCSAGRGRTGTIIASFLIAETLNELLIS